MSLEQRLASQFFAERYAALIVSMSLQDAKATLGFPPTANPTAEEINKAYKRKAIENHPDRGGDAAKMVEVNVAKDILDGKQRPDGGRRQAPPSGNRPTYEDYVKKKQEADAKKVYKGDSFVVAKAQAPHNVTWKFHSDYFLGRPSDYTKSEDPLAYVLMWVCYGQTDSKHVFMLVEHALPNRFAAVQLDSWSMEKVLTFPLTQDLEKLAPKVVKSIASDGKLSAGFTKAPSKYYAMTELTEVEMNRRGGGVGLKDILLGTGLASGAASDRNVVVELAGTLNRAKVKENPKLMTMDGWKWYDFTLYVNGKPYPLSQATINNLGSHGTSGNLFWMSVYSGSVNYDYSRRRVITKMRGFGSKLLEMIEESLSGEPADLTLQLLKAIESLEPENKTAAFKLAAIGLSPMDDFLSSKVACRYLEEE